MILLPRIDKGKVQSLGQRARIDKIKRFCKYPDTLRGRYYYYYHQTFYWRCSSEYSMIVLLPSIVGLLSKNFLIYWTLEYVWNRLRIAESNLMFNWEETVTTKMGQPPGTHMKERRKRLGFLCINRVCLLLLSWSYI